MHILSCRYNLTRTGYKYLEIGIGIPPTADAVAVNIMLENTTDKEILLSTEMWRGLVDSRSIICDYLARVNSEHCPTPPMCLDDLTVRFATLNDQPTIRLDTPSGRLTLSTSTVRYLYGLRHCVKRITSTMASVVGRVDDKMSTLKAAELKKKLKDRNLPTTGTKAELVKRLLEAGVQPEELCIGKHVSDEELQSDEPQPGTSAQEIAPTLQEAYQYRFAEKGIQKAQKRVTLPRDSLPIRGYSLSMRFLIECKLRTDIALVSLHLDLVGSKSGDEAVLESTTSLMK
ncbi:hypothetical protein DMN91_001627 [Ooceraea biroi]|uniref:SAP domain-containing protein n=1 Tax=Ooceraea biroi TaxID=2015173 RepID=A0A3L8DYE4_OOCBI|nr:hypothetical protein DMN91_001627 [Ooceraea biroi]